MAPLSQKQVLKKLEEYNNIPLYERISFHPFENVEIGDLDLIGFKFEEDLNFSYAKFTGKADFRFVQFIGNADFLRAKFSGDANFVSAQFSRKAYFIEAKFSGDAFFSFAKFSGDAFFRFAKFSGDAFFRGAKFLGKTYFEGHDEIKEENYYIKEDYIFKQNAYFANITFDPEKLSLKKVNLSKCTFLDTDLTKIDFTDVQWAKQPIFLNRGKRNSLYDEENADSSSYSLVEKLYRQLKLNYEKKGDYPYAGDFHFGEMEMKRKQLPKWRRDFLSFIPWYKYLSGYGEKYGLAFIWLILILFGFAIGYTFLDFETTKAADLSFHFGHSLMYSLKIMTLQRYALNFEPVTALGSNLTTIQGILGPLQIALFALALRRRFKR